MIQSPIKKSNPLISFMRQPKIYIRLPSGGEYWGEDNLELTETGEYPVYSMTAKDELMLKVPDALMNGQAVVDVIQNCIPNIKNAWATPNIDIDLILIAIRLATYGEQMEMSVKFGDDLDLDYTVDLRTVMDSLISQVHWDPTISISENMTIFVKPLCYRDMTKSAIQSFETQKIMDVVGNTTMSDDEKIKLFQDSFKKLTESTIGTIRDSISRIDTDQGSTDDPEYISEFINNTDKEIFNKIQKHLETLRDKNTIKPMQVAVTDEMREKGVTGDTVEVPLTFDPSTFFV